MTEARHEPKIHPGKRPGAVFGPLQFDAADPGNPARLEWQRAGLVEPDMEIVRDYRLARLRAELARRDLAGAVLTDPINIRYATDAANMQVWCLHNAVRYVYVATEGPVVLWDFHGCGHVSGHLTRISERRPAISWFWFEAGPTEGDNARRWAAEIADLVRATGGGNMRIGIDKCESRGLAALAAEGVTVHQSQDFAEDARRIKHPEEIKAMRRAVFTAEIGIAEMWRGLRPGLTENQLWSILHQANIARGGEWIETRLLSSGPRTNPWFAECSDRVIEAGDIVAFDTDLIGPYGYCADISRSASTLTCSPSNMKKCARVKGRRF
ncbi:MAG: M24 family metallopeptidase, partial [Thermaurantiacus sp.]